MPGRFRHRPDDRYAASHVRRGFPLLSWRVAGPYDVTSRDRAAARADPRRAAGAGYRDDLPAARDLPCAQRGPHRVGLTGLAARQRLSTEGSIIVNLTYSEEQAAYPAAARHFADERLVPVSQEFNMDEHLSADEVQS